MPSSQTKTTRLEARIAPDALEMVRRAAEIEGRSVSDFVVSAARAAAEKAIEDAQIIRLSLEDQRALAAALFNPPAPASALKRASKSHRRLIAQSR